MTYMCAHCGCTRSYHDHYTNGSTRYWSSYEDGEDYESEDLDFEENGDESDDYCAECNSTDLIHIDDLCEYDIEILREANNYDERMDLFHKIAFDEPIIKEPEKSRLGKLIGGKPIQ